MKTIFKLTDVKKIKLSDRKDYYFEEKLVTSFPINDCGEKLIYLSNLFQENNIDFVFDPPSDLATEYNELKLRETAANKLLVAAKKLPQDLKFKISEGYRPMWYQEKIFKEIYEELRQKDSQKNDQEIWDMTTQFVADPKLCPPHTTGGAIDITLINPEGNEIDMGNPMNSIDDNSNTFTTNIDRTQKYNRQQLFDVLTSVGFVNLPTEWWHYSYGDQYWAIFNDQDNAIYGPV